jgi:hypothetical protein
MDNKFNEFSGITKLLDLVMKSLEVDEVDYNGGHKVVEDILNPIIKNSCILVVNVWDDGYIIEFVLSEYMVEWLTFSITVLFS